jgi:predicted transcriptional regulator
MLKKYLKLMRRHKLIEKSKMAEAMKSEQTFQATEKGITFLKVYCDILRIIYGEDFMQNHNNMAVTCIKYCKEAE